MAAGLAGRLRRLGRRLVFATLVGPVLAGCLFREGPQSGPPLAPGTRECIGVPVQICDEQVASLRQTGNGEPIAYRIRCTRLPGCTLQDGDASVDALYANGATSNGGVGWAGARPVVP